MTSRRRVSIFDIDGTIFRSSLLIELTEALIQENIFPGHARKIYAASYGAWLDRKDSYEKYIRGVVTAYEQNIKGVEHKEFLRTARKVVAFHKNRVYRYTRKLVSALKKRKFYMIAVSNSPREIVEEFCKKLGFDKVYGRIYEVGRDAKFTGRILYLDVISDKAKILKRAIEKENLTLKGSVGVGDTESDIPFLKMVQNPICFNPNMNLFRVARRQGWKTVVERKDVIYPI